jgi:Tfp pilus assembly protein PilF
MPDQDMATQYYYETLSYLSKALLYPGYPQSQEILANAALISWYEAFDTEASTNWERHLKGVFWIQRSQNTNGEAEGLRKAVW